MYIYIFNFNERSMAVWFLSFLGSITHRFSLMYRNRGELVVGKLKWSPFFKVPNFLILETRKSIRGSQGMGELFVHMLIPSSLSSCWRSSRAHDCLLTLKLDLGIRRILIPSLGFEMYVLPIVPRLEATSRTHP